MGTVTNPVSPWGMKKAWPGSAWASESPRAQVCLSGCAGDRAQDAGTQGPCVSVLHMGTSGREEGCQAQDYAGEGKPALGCGPGTCPGPELGTVDVHPQPPPSVRRCWGQ